MSGRIIGGFFALDDVQQQAGRSIASLWQLDKLPHWKTHNARSALNALLIYLKPTTLWLPSYCCEALAESATNTEVILRFYPLRDNLSPDLAFLEQHLSAGDAMVAINYFGRIPDEDFLAYCRNRNDIYWIEDRAQMLAPHENAWGDYILYSPRKLCGVADGGIMVGARKILPSLSFQPLTHTAFLEPSRMRRADVNETQNSQWYSAYQRAESAMRVEDKVMSNDSVALIKGLDPYPWMEQRKSNYAYLMEYLSSLAFLPQTNSDFVPFGFPIRLTKRAEMAKALYAHRIFPAHHWAQMPSPQSEFRTAHHMANELLTLPCDQRYDLSDMKRMAETVLETMKRL